MFISPRPRWSGSFTLPPVDGAKILSMLRVPMQKLFFNMCVCVSCMCDNDIITRMFKVDQHVALYLHVDLTSFSGQNRHLHRS